MSAIETEQLISELETSASPLVRAAAWIDLYESMLEGGVPPGRLLTAGMTALETEPTDLLVSRLLDDLAEVYWRYLEIAQRRSAAAAVEHALRHRLNAAGNGDKASRWIRALSRFALTPDGAAELESIWQGDREGCGDPAEALAVELALRLALLRPDCAAVILERQQARTIDRNRRERLEFLAPALAAERAERDALFGRLIAGEGRGVWAVAALQLLSHPLRAEDAIDYLEPGIERAVTLARQSEIFLPRQWLNALFQGHGTAEAERRIRAGVARYEHTPGFRSLLLETADPVFRAAAIRGRSASR